MALLFYYYNKLRINILSWDLHLYDLLLDVDDQSRARNDARVLTRFIYHGCIFTCFPCRLSTIMSSLQTRSCTYHPVYKLWTPPVVPIVRLIDFYCSAFKGFIVLTIYSLLPIPLKLRPLQAYFPGSWW